MANNGKAGRNGGSATPRPRGRPRLEDVAKLERKIISVALREFLKHGYGGTSMATIVKSAGISKTTLYSRYSSKRDLFLAVMRNLYEDNRVLDKAMGGKTFSSLEDGLKAYARETLNIGMQEKIKGIDRLIYSEAHRFPDLGRAARQLNDSLVLALRKFIAHRAEVDGIPCRDPSRPAEAFSQMIRGFHVTAMLSPENLTDEEVNAWADRAVTTLLAARADW